VASPPASEALLESLRAQRVRQVQTLERAFQAVVDASESSNADDEHDPEGATIAFERSQLAAQLALARAGVAEVDEALRRVALGTYGVCTACGGTIPAGRLEALPAAATCVACAQRA
jgi:DnaK suppressor protein